MVIIGDHGNAEAKINHTTGQNQTAHTLNPVPCVMINKQAKQHRTIQFPSHVELGLANVAPTLLKIMGYPIPEDMTSGRFYSSDEEEGLAQVVVLGSKLKDKLFGDQEAVGESVYVKGLPFKVTGVLKPQGGGFIDMDSIAYIPTKTVQKKMLGTDYVMGILLDVKDTSKIDSTKNDIIALLEERHNITDPTKDDFEASTLVEARQMIDSILNGITLLLVALTFISLIVGGVGITNIMYVSVIERTFEIGLRRAVGATRQDILMQFLSESIILTFAAAAISSKLSPRS
jgi:putative ABC transport system permease protein